MATGDYIDDEYISSVKVAGNPPANVDNLVSDTKYFGLFETFAANQDTPGLDVYLYALRGLLLENKDAGVVWEEVKSRWVGGDDSLYELLESEPLKEALVKDANEQLAQPYSDFVNVVTQIKSGSFDNEDSNDEGELEEEDEAVAGLEELLEELAVELDKKTDNVLKNFLDSLNENEYQASKDQLATEINNLKKIDSHDKQAIRQLRRSSTIDANDLNKLLEELDSDEVEEVEEDELGSLLNELAEVTEDQPKQAILQLFDLSQLQATENELDKLFDALEDYRHSEKNKSDVRKLRRSSTIDANDINKLIEELGADVDVDPGWNERVDRLIEELAEEVPGGTLSKNVLVEVLPDDILSDDELDRLIDGLVLLQNDDSPLVRRRLSSLISASALQDLLDELEAPVAPKSRPKAYEIDDWDTDFVTRRNYDTLKLSEGGDPLPVLVCGDYVLIGDSFSSDYTNGFLKAYEGDKAYPAGQGLVERGTAIVEKGSGLFNPGKVQIRNISSGRNRSAVTATITARSKKKVVFVD